tara:strand:- start:83 stop:1219 length:1137 start_codon:yes stop_codon:yes gene_type:complete
MTNKVVLKDFDSPSKVKNVKRKRKKNNEAIKEEKEEKKIKEIKEVKKVKEDKNKKNKCIKKDKIKEPEEPVVKKKRGRKKKIKTPEEIEREKNKPKQRRGRKPKSLITNINSKNSQLLLESCKNDNSKETIILNLKINNDNDTLDNKSPIGFDINENIYSSIDNKNNDIIENDDVNNISSDILNNNMTNNDDKIVNDNNWVLNKNKTCYWCCHSFNNNSFGIPIKYKNKKFYTYGCFCSLECAAAHNFSEDRNVQDIWECYSLINLFSQTINYKNIVKLAPNRICLKMFGGTMTIEEFRNFTNSNKITNILEYPMIPISQQIEEINYDNSYNKNDYIPIDQDRVKKLEQKIKLMRTTPLLNHKNTLEHTMNIKINETD